MNNDQSTGMSWLAVLFIIIVIAALFGGFGNGFGFGFGLLSLLFIVYRY